MIVGKLVDRMHLDTTTFVAGLRRAAQSIKRRFGTMPTSPPTACPCGGKRQRGEACDRCGRGGRKAARKAYDDRRGNAAQRGYGYAWQKAREGYLRSHPLCAECAKDGRVTAATVVDHIVPHRGNQELFWDYDNWQALCERCHNTKTARGL